MLALLSDRPNSYDPVERLRWQGEHRAADLLPLRYQRMLASPLAFYRGAALLMADDLARGSSTSLEVQICGDAHLSNFGVFSSPERRLVFDMNDFDETAPGPFEWDVKRLTASLAIASHHLGHDSRHQAKVVFEAAREYQRAMSRFAHEGRLDVWYASLNVESILLELRGFLGDSALRRVDDVVHRAKGMESRFVFKQMVTDGPHGPRIIANPPHVTPLSTMASGSLLSQNVIDPVLAGYRETLNSDRQALLAQFTPVDAARQVVGIGSVGTECYIILLVGRDDSDVMFLQVKAATQSVVALAREFPTAVGPGERVVAGQRLMQATPDVFLGWHTVGGTKSERGYYVRQLYDNKASVRISELNATQLEAYGRVCAWALARAHARSGHGAQIAGYLGRSERFAEAMVAFALAYRDRNSSDYRALTLAVERGTITAAS